MYVLFICWGDDVLNIVRNSFFFFKLCAPVLVSYDKSYVNCWDFQLNILAIKINKWLSLMIINYIK